jgi:hypothetical protein
MEYMLLAITLGFITKLGMVAYKVDSELEGLPLAVFLLVIFNVVVLKLVQRKRVDGRFSLTKRLQLQWTLFVVQSKQVRLLKSRINDLETENRELNQELNGLQQLWHRTQQVAAAPAAEPVPQAETRAPSKLFEPQITSQFFNDNFFDIHTSVPQSHSIKDKVAEASFD